MYNQGYYTYNTTTIMAKSGNPMNVFVDKCGNCGGIIIPGGCACWKQLSKPDDIVIGPGAIGGEGTLSWQQDDVQGGYYRTQGKFKSIPADTDGSLFFSLVSYTNNSRCLATIGLVENFELDHRYPPFIEFAFFLYYGNNKISENYSSKKTVGSMVLLQEYEIRRTNGEIEYFVDGIFKYKSLSTNQNELFADFQGKLGAFAFKDIRIELNT